jgi:hypothetical protein
MAHYIRNEKLNINLHFTIYLSAYLFISRRIVDIYYTLLFITHYYFFLLLNFSCFPNWDSFIWLLSASDIPPSWWGFLFSSISALVLFQHCNTLQNHFVCVLPMSRVRYYSVEPWCLLLENGIRNQVWAWVCLQAGRLLFLGYLCWQRKKKNRAIPTSVHSHICKHFHVLPPASLSHSFLFCFCFWQY